MSANDGHLSKEFSKDPVKSVLYAIGMEKRKNGYDIAKKVYEQYFVKNNKKEVQEQYAEVKIKSREIVITSYTNNMQLQLGSDYGFFKGVDESVDLLSYFNDGNDVYYYNYAHRGQISLAKMMNPQSDIDFGNHN